MAVSVDHAPEMTADVRRVREREHARLAGHDIAPHSAIVDRLAPGSLEGMIDGGVDRPVVPGLECA